jgi:hypothetical protein
MNRRGAALLAGLCAVMLGVLAAPASAAGPYDMRIWMMPPMDVSSAGSCLTQRWHSANGHALDWNKNCGSGASNVYFRTRALSEDEPDIVLIPWAQAEPYQLPDPPCGSGSGSGNIDQAQARIRSTWDGLVKGQMVYAHAVVWTTSPKDILFQGGPTYSDYSWFNSFDIADTASDAAVPDCWTGYHLHENNVTSSAWDRFNTIKWNTAPTQAEYDNDYIGHWIRSLGWVDD